MKAFRVEIVPEPGTDQGTWIIARRGNWVLVPYKKWEIAFYRSEAPPLPRNFTEEDIDGLVQMVTEMAHASLVEELDRRKRDAEKEAMKDELKAHVEETSARELGISIIRNKDDEN